MKKYNFVKTSTFEFLIHLMAYISVPFFIMSIMVMGKLWYYPYAVLIIFTVPFVSIFAVFLFFYNLLIFDDENKNVIKGYNFWRLPYLELRNIHVINAGSFYSVLINEGMKKIVLIAFAHKRNKKTVLEKLKQISNQDIIIEKEVKPRRVIVLLAVCIFILYAGYIGRIYYDYPVAFEIPKKYTHNAGNSETLSYSLNGITFEIQPPEKSRIDKNAIFLWRENGNINIVADTFKFPFARLPMFKNILKINNSYEFMNAALNTRFSLYLMHMKTAIITNRNNVEIYKFDNGRVKGFMIRGIDRHKPRYLINIYAFDTVTDKEIDFTFYARDKDEYIVSTIIKSLR